MTAQLSNVDCCGVFLLVEKYEEEYNFCCTALSCTGVREENQMVATLVQLRIFQDKK